MNSHITPTAAPRSSGPDDLDRLLSGFFQSEVPRSWPAAPSLDVEPSTLAMARTGSSLSRWVLAASVALLVGTCWFASSGTSPQTSPTASQKNDAMKGKAGQSSILDEMEKHRIVTDGELTKP